MTRNNVRPMFVKKTSMTNFARSFGHITSYGSNINRLKAPVMLSDTTVKRCIVIQEDLTEYWKSEKDNISQDD